MVKLFQCAPLPACALMLWIAAAPPALAGTGNFYLGPTYAMDGYTVDPFESSQVAWMKSQATYWRRREYSDLTKEAGTPDYYRKGDLIAAQVKLDYAKADMTVIKDPLQAMRDLEDAMALLQHAKSGASEDEVLEIKQITDALDRIKGRISNPPPSQRANQAVSKDLGHAADALKHYVERS